MDDLLDLNFDKKAHQAPNGGVRPAGQGSSSSYNFDALTRGLPSGGSTPLRTASPAVGSAQVSRSASSQGPAGNGKAQAGGKSEDAFASLFAGASSSTASAATGSASSSSKMTLQERQKQMTGAYGSSVANMQGKGDSSSWGGLDDWESLGSGSNTKPSIPVPAKAATVSQATKTAQASSSNSPKPAAKAADPFDFSSFEDLGASQSSALAAEHDDYPFSAFESNKPSPSTNAADDSDDILGALSKPADQLPKQTAPRQTAPQGAPSRRSKSPPPHLIGQLVEMGFSPAQARRALAETETGMDVQAAMEKLLGAGEDEPASERVPPSRSRDTGGRHEDRDRALAERLQREEQSSRSNGPRSMTDEFQEWQRRQQAGGGDRASFERPGDRRRQQERFTDEESPEWQKSADQLYAQASELGTAVFSRATAFWNTAKASAAKAIEEHRAATSADASGDERGSGRSTPNLSASAASAARAFQRKLAGKDAPPRSDGRPKWMVDNAGEEEEKGTTNGASAPSGGFKDSDDEDVAPAPSFLEPRPAAKPKEEIRGRESPQPPPQNMSRSARLAAATEEAPTYISPARRRAKAQAAPSQNAPSRPAPPPAALRTRSIVADAPDAKAWAFGLKDQGNEAFKKGAYGEAETLYGRALDCLEEGSLRRIPLLNNRANARIKNGDSAAAMRDCDAVMKLIVPESTSSDIKAFRPKEEHPLPSDVSADVNLRDAWAKALLRKAQAAEALERWTTARKAWDTLIEFEKQEGSGKAGVTNLRSAQTGHARCMEMITGKKAQTQATPKAPSRASQAAVSRIEKAAKEKLDAMNAAEEKENQEKFALKDMLDAKLAAWKGGKETNIRALLSSVDTLVWPSLGWKKVGMHELVTDAQVKKAYTRAIAKLHPDKLNANNTTLEQRLIANDVFSTLNLAWAASQK